MKFVCIIPARYGSKRLPGKALAQIKGSPMIEWVYRRASAADFFEDIVVATDDTRIFDSVNSFGGKAIMTAENLASGTDRLASVIDKFPADIYVNVQGDEPLVSTRLLKDVCSPYQDENVLMTTAIKKVNNEQELLDPNNVRVVIDKSGDALYFTRAVIPYIREQSMDNSWLEKVTFYKHIGIYTYRRDFLLKYSHLEPGYLEQVEKLEQLRVLEHGFKIRTVLTNYESRSVDTVEDLASVTKFVEQNNIRVDTIDEKV